MFKQTNKFKPQYLKDDGGNVTLMFALSLTTLIIAVGAAIDYASIEQRHTALQQATDSAILAAALSGETELPKLKKVTESVFDQNFRYDTNESLKAFDLKFSEDDELTLDIKIKRPTTFMKIVGVPEVYAGANSATFLKSSTPLDIALVLDRTGSMAGPNLNNLIAAAGQFVTDVEASGRDVRIAVVPFSNYVNVGTHHANMSWLDLPNMGVSGSEVECKMQSLSATSCPSVTWSGSGSGSGSGSNSGSGSSSSSSSTSTTTTTTASSSSGTSSSTSRRTTSRSTSCGRVTTIVETQSRTSGGMTTTTTTTTTSTSGSGAGTCAVTMTTGSGGTVNWSDIFSGSSGALCTISPNSPDNSSSQIEECTPKKPSENWFGCVGSRLAPYNTQAGYDGEKFPPVFNRSCGQPITELTNSYSAVRMKISDLTASGTTYIPAGLQWGWRVLDKNLPFESNDTETRQKLLILMTDGQNNRSQIGTFHNGKDNSAANSLTLNLCDNIKASGIEVATVLYSNGYTGAHTDQVLRNCASTADLTFSAGNANSLRQAFESAAEQMDEIRLIR